MCLFHSQIFVYSNSALAIACVALASVPLRAQSTADTGAFFDAVKAGDRARIEFAARRTPALLQRADADGLTALHLAARAGNLEVTRLLVERGAKLEAKARENEKQKARPVFAPDKGYKAVIGEKTPLQLTTDPAVAAYLLEKGAKLPKVEVTCAGDETWSLLRWKPAKSSPELLAAALKAGADPNERCKANSGTCCDPTAFAFIDKPVLLQTLLAGGLDPNISSFRNGKETGRKAPTNTLLHEVSRKGDADSVRLLLAKGAQVNAVDAQGSTPVSGAATPEIATLLKAAGGK